MDKAKLFASAEKLIAKGQHQKAIDSLEQILKKDARDLKALNKLAESYLKVGDTERAIEYFEKLGSLYTKDGFYSKAVAIYKRILSQTQNSEKSEVISIHQKLAGLYGQLGLVSDAMSHFKLVVDYYDQMEDREALLEVLKQVSDLDPQNIDSQLKLAELFVAEQRTEDAVETLSRLLESAESQAKIGDKVRIFEKWTSLFPTDVEALSKLISSYLQAGEPKKALGRLQKAFRSDPYNPEVLELLSSTFREMKQPEKAKAVDVELVKIYRKEEETEKLEQVEARIKGQVPEVVQDNSEESTVRRDIQDDALDPADALIENMSLAAEEKKILSECEVYLKYGLADKAKEVLSQQIQNFPKSLALRWKHKNVLSETQSKDDVIHALSELILLAKEQKQPDWVKLASDELQSLDKNHPSLSAEPLEEPEVLDLGKENLVEEASPGFEADTMAGADVDDSDISIIVEDDLMSGSTEQPEFVDEDLQEEISKESDPKQAPQPTGEKPSAEESDSEEEPLLLDEAEPVAELPQQEGASEEGGQEAEFLLSEDDFSDEELAQFSNQVNPTDEPQTAEPVSNEVEAKNNEDEKAQEDEEEYLELSLDDEEPQEPLDLEPAEESGPQGLSLDESEEVVGDKEFEIRQGLEEVAFFQSQGLIEEADQLLESLKAKYPDHQDWEVREHSIPQESAAVGQKKEVDLEALGTKMKMTVQEDDRSEGDDFFDLAGELEEELEEKPESSVPAEVGDVFNAFKQGVSESVAEDDFQTHFDLGVAYREMGLVDDAIAEFELCSKLDGKRVSSLYQIGLCEFSRENYKKSVEAFDEALSDPSIENQERLSVSYELAEALIKLNEVDRAKKLFSEVQEIDPEFRDVQEKLEAIQA